MKKEITKDKLLELVDYLIDLASEYDIEDVKGEVIEVLNERAEENAHL